MTTAADPGSPEARQESLHEALGELREDEVVKGALGVIADEFVELKEKEWAEYHAQVSKWEIDRYLTLF